MTKYAAIAIFVLRLVYQPASLQAQDATNFKNLTSDTKVQPRISNVKVQATGNRIILNWDVAQNSQTDQFEIEKSTDGRHYKLVALVFGSEDANDAQYMFYEKAGSKTVQYRIKLISKNKNTEYSKPVEVRPVI